MEHLVDREVGPDTLILASSTGEAVAGAAYDIEDARKDAPDEETYQEKGGDDADDNHAACFHCGSGEI